MNVFRRIPPPSEFSSSKISFSSSNIRSRGSNNKQFPKKHAMTSCWHWHRSAKFVSTPFSVWSCGWRRRIRWREPSIGYLLKFIWCTMIAFVVSYPSYHLHNSCFSCHAYASLGYVPMLAFFLGFSRYLDGPSVSRPIDSFLLWFPFAIKPSPIITEFTISSCCCQRFQFLLVLCYSRTPHFIQMPILYFKLISNW